MKIVDAAANPMSLSNKVTVVTGGAGGIGRAIAVRLGRAAVKVAICDMDSARLEQTVQEMRGDRIETLGMICDVRESGQVDSFIDVVVERWGGINFLINNAGICARTPITMRNDEAWHRILSTNLNGVYYCSRRVLQDMPSEGRIVNVSSISGKVGDSGYTAYCASKHAVIGFTRALALEVAHRRITVNAICPGWTETDMARRDLEESARSNNLTSESFRERAIQKIPLHRMIQPQEVAELAHFLLLPLASILFT